MIYLDNAATTRVKPEVIQEMLPYYEEIYGNPSSIYRLGNRARTAVNKAREQLSSVIGADTNEIYFTSGGSESDNWALKAACEMMKKSGKNHMITTKIEHHAVLNTCEYLKKQGVEVTYLEVDTNGMISLVQLEKEIRMNTGLISVMYANNEIGTIQPVLEIGKIAREHGVLFHTDAVQAFGQLPIDVEACRIDLLSASAHKLNGPKGVGLLYVRSGVKLPSLLQGGQQERHKRAGTENVPAIVGFAKAAMIATGELAQKQQRECMLRDYLIQRIADTIPDCVLNGDRKNRLPNNVNYSFAGVEGESVLMMLDMADICASSGSACTSGEIEPSHVLLAAGQDYRLAHGSVRMTLSMDNTIEEMDYVVDKLAEIIEKLRKMRG